jgi:hypothetical protein
MDERMDCDLIDAFDLLFADENFEKKISAKKFLLNNRIGLTDETT